MRPGRQVHEVQAVVGPKSEIRDQQVGWLVEQAGAGVPKVGTCLDVGHESQRGLHRAQLLGIRIDKENFFGAPGHSGRPWREIDMVMLDLSRHDMARKQPYLHVWRSARRGSRLEGVHFTAHFKEGAGRALGAISCAPPNPHRCQ